MIASHPSWNPDNFARRRGNLVLRGRVIACMREYFAAQRFTEVDTPILQTMPGGEVHLDAFATELKGPCDKKGQTLYLHTSPEFAMKKLLVAGLPRIYQLAHTFRNGERSSLHHPEFTMLEWYRSKEAEEVSLIDIKQDCIEMVRAAAKGSDRKKFSFGNMVCDPFAEWETLGVPEAFKRYAGIDLLATAPDPLKPDADLLASEVKRIGLRAGKDDSWDDLFFRVMGEKIEPYLGKDRPTFLCDYPRSMAALARANPADPRLAERFELYICGIELANAFAELTDAREQERRLNADMAEKKKLYGENWPVDEDFLAALRFGMPESAGIALGLDRLVLLCAGAAHIEDVLWLPVPDTGSGSAPPAKTKAC